MPVILRQTSSNYVILRILYIAEPNPCAVSVEHLYCTPANPAIAEKESGKALIIGESEGFKVVKL